MCIGDKVYLHEPPPLDELCANIEVMELQKVESLAIQLKISSSKRNEIFDPYYQKNKLNNVFIAWLQEYSKPTRHQVIKALHDIGENKAAHDYVKKIG